MSQVHNHKVPRSGKQHALASEAFVAIDPPAGVVGFVGGNSVRQAPFGPALTVPVLYVLQSHRRRGLGRRLMHALGQRMAQNGPGEVEVWALASNNSARAFYQAIGGRLAGVSTDRDHDRAALAGYRWRSAVELIERTAAGD